MKTQIKVKRWIAKNVLGQKITTGRPKKQQLLPVVTQPEPQVIYQQQYEQPSRLKGTFDMKAVALTVTVCIAGIGALIWWLQTYISETAALIALVFVGMFIMYVVKDILDNLKLKQHNESQRITADMLTDFNRQDAMTDNYRQKTTIENTRFARQQLSYDQQELRNQQQQLRLQRQERAYLPVSQEVDVDFDVYQ